jgi:hypothetical protein
MEKTRMCLTGLFFLVLISTTSLQAQDEEKKSNFSTGADFYTNYIWRGTKYGTGPSLQPSVKFNSGVFTMGVWGSYDAHGYAETDPYISLAFKSGFSFGLTDYYYPGLRIFNVTDTAGSNALEINAGFTKGGFSLSANYIVNEAGGAASAGGDKYFQVGYSFSNVSLFAGAGDGWHTSNGKFNLCNVGVGATKVIDVTEKFSIPVNGQVILNPEREQLFVVVGFSF